MGILPLTGWWTELEGYVFDDRNRNGVQGRRRAGHPQHHAHHAQAGELAHGPRRHPGHHRRHRPLLHGERLPHDPVAGHGGLRRPLVHHRRHLPGRQPAGPDHHPRRRRRRQRAPGHRPGRPPRLGRARLRRRRRHLQPGWPGQLHQLPRPAQRRHRRHGQLRHHPQRAQRAVRGGGGLAAGHLRPHREPLRAGGLRHHAARPATPSSARASTSSPPDGSYAKGTLLNTYVTETWSRPGQNGDGTCVPRNVDGNPLAYPAGQQITDLRPPTASRRPLMGVQFQAGFSAVDGNYGFGEGCYGGDLAAAVPTTRPAPAASPRSWATATTSSRSRSRATPSPAAPSTR